MIGELITLPVRVTFRATSCFMRGTEEVLKRALALTGRSAETFAGPSAEAAPRRRGTDEDNLYDGDATASTPTAATPAPAPSTADTFAPPRPARPRPTERQRPPTALGALGEEPTVSEEETILEMPTHVSEEPTIVEEVAEVGAEEGAGAQVTIDEPWDGYARMSAKEVIARVSESDAAELAAVSLYEAANRARQTVLSAVDRQLVLAQRSRPSN